MKTPDEIMERNKVIYKILRNVFQHPLRKSDIYPREHDLLDELVSSGHLTIIYVENENSIYIDNDRYALTKTGKKLLDIFINPFYYGK